jgi:hypothetical protein
VSALEEVLLPLSQFAMRYLGHIGLHDYEGVALDTDERARLIADLGPHNVLLLHNHGVLTLARTIPEALILAYYFEKASRVQLLAQGALASGARLALPTGSVTEKTASQFNDLHGDLRTPDSRQRPAFIRLLDRLDPPTGTDRYAERDARDAGQTKLNHDKQSG